MILAVQRAWMKYRRDTVKRKDLQEEHKGEDLKENEVDLKKRSRASRNYKLMNKSDSTVRKMRLKSREVNQISFNINIKGKIRLLKVDFQLDRLEVRFSNEVFQMVQSA